MTHDVRGDLYELAKILGHANSKMTERYAKLGRQHIAKTGNTAREVWKLMEEKKDEPKDEIAHIARAVRYWYVYLKH